MKILKISSKNYKKIIRETTKSIKKGEVIICPTDTVYGLVCDARNEVTVKKLFKIKKRMTKKPIPIFIKDIKEAKRLAFINKNQEKFLKEIWPGKVTVVLKKKNNLPKTLFGRRKTIGLRIPKYKLVNVLLEKLNHPLTGTSANISGKPASTKIKKVLRQFNTAPLAKGAVQPDLILNAGNLKLSKSSTVIDFTREKPKILRKGEIKK